MLALYAATLLLAAALLFIVEPMFAKMVLPLLGGTPAVWNTCVVFFQATLLLAYLYVHVTTTLFGIRKQAAVHALLVLLPFTVLPIAIGRDWMPAGGAPPIPWLIGLMVFAVGLPFFVVATTAPLLQRWFTASGHQHARDPYFLYAASNLGSLIGLLSYPIALEPGLRLSEQSRYWMLAYAAFVLLILACMALVWRQLSAGVSGPHFSPHQPPDSARSTACELPDFARTRAQRATSRSRRSAPTMLPREGGRRGLAEATVIRREGGSGGLYGSPVTTARRVRWVVLSLVPSSLMLGVTTYLSVDIAAVPLLWVVPLTIYLLTFVLAFSTRPTFPQPILRRLLPILALTLVVLILRDATQPSWLVVPLHLVGFFIAAQVCHGELAADRPAAPQLTQFYLWISFGGVVGGVFNSIVAPLVFTGVVEYPVALVVACALLPARAGAASTTIRRDLLTAAGIGALTVVLVRIARAVDPAQGAMAVALMLGVPALVCFRLVARPRRFAMSLAMMLAACAVGPGRFGTVLHAERSFYGVHRVTTDPTGRFHVLLHGHTIHGRQSLDPQRRGEPLTYFHRTGPIGQVFSAHLPRMAAGSEVAVVGLGSGSLVSYARPDQRWTFYEIDPAVERIARDPRYFTFLSDAPAAWRVVLGDARLSLREARQGVYAMLVLDAFSSDAIPVHLLTREAIDLYLSKLKDDGVLAFHISNNYLRLRPVVAALAQDAGLVGIAQFDVRINADEARGGKTASEWVVVARTPEALGALADDPRWTPLAADATPLWRDDFSNILRVFKW